MRAFEIDNCYNVDCLYGMRLMKEQGLKADWCITDPPYGIGIDKQNKKVCKNSKHNRKEHSGGGAGIIAYRLKAYSTVYLSARIIKLFSELTISIITCRKEIKAG